MDTEQIAGEAAAALALAKSILLELHAKGVITYGEAEAVIAKACGSMDQDRAQGNLPDDAGAHGARRLGTVLDSAPPPG